MRRFSFVLLAIICSLGWPGPVGAEIAIGFANPLSGPYALSGHMC